MQPTSLPFFRATALLGFLAVALGAFGAHALNDLLVQRQRLPYWEKAVLYHFVHVAAMLAICYSRPFPRAAWSLLGAGVLLFSGSLYVLAVATVRWPVFLTPLGGLCFLAGWTLLAIHGWTHAADADPSNPL